LGFSDDCDANANFPDHAGVARAAAGLRLSMLHVSLYRFVRHGRPFGIGQFAADKDPRAAPAERLFSLQRVQYHEDL
jgi:hypothetical protein